MDIDANSMIHLKVKIGDVEEKRSMYNSGRLSSEQIEKSIRDAEGDFCDGKLQIPAEISLPVSGNLYISHPDIHV